MQAQVRKLVSEILKAKNENFSFDWNILLRNQPVEVAARVCSELKGWGPLDLLIKDDKITEIVINDYDRIFIEIQGALHASEDHFYSLQTYLDCIERISQSCHTYLNREKPFIEVQLNTLRMTIIFGELASGRPLISIRKQPERIRMLVDLLEFNFLNIAQLDFLKQLIKSKKNFIIVGGTSSGKTSLLQALLMEIGSLERSIIVEDTQELKPPNRASISLLSRSDPSAHIPNVEMTDLIKRAMRLRPDRLVVGEIRGAEAKSLLLALSSGHQGSCGSMHANSASDGLLRLEMLIQMGAPEWNLYSIRRLIASTIHYVLTVEKNEERRFLADIHEIQSAESNGITLTPIFENSTRKTYD